MNHIVCKFGEGLKSVFLISYFGFQMYGEYWDNSRAQDAEDVFTTARVIFSLCLSFKHYEQMDYMYLSGIWS